MSLDFLGYYQNLKDRNKSEEYVSAKEHHIVNSIRRIAKPRVWKEYALENFVANDVFDLKFETKQTKRSSIYNYLQRKIADKLVQPLFLKNQISKLLDMLHPSICVLISETKKMESVFKTDVCYELSVYETQEGTSKKNKIFYAIGGTLDAKYHYGVHRRTGVHCVNIYRFFADLLIWTEVRKFIDNIVFMSEEDIGNNIPYKLFLKSIKEKNYSCTHERCIMVDLHPSIREDLGTMIKISAEYSSNCTKIYPLDIINLYFMHKKPLPLLAVLSSEYGNANKGYSFFSGLTDVFMILANEYNQDKSAYEYENSLTSDYAKSFEEKKNIPQKVRKAMECSKFHTVFGMVEFDAETDLVLVKKLEEEFLELNNNIFYMPQLSDYSLRFRKLGNHKAAGLYYPAYKCICVDLDNPSSFVHEFFHMMDFMQGKLSRKYRFQDIYMNYVELLNKEISSNVSLRERLKKGSSKYNFSYYTQATEVFARCGEIYINRIIGVENSLINSISASSDSFAYPEDKALEMKIEDYYGELLQLSTKEV